MKLLLIAGIGESVGLARDLSATAGFEVICATQGRAVARAQPPTKNCDSHFETDQEFLDYLGDQCFDMVVDAAHPFEFRLGQLARTAGLAYLRVVRPVWMPKASEHWINAPSIEGAVAAIPAGARAFVATGRGSLAAFSARPDVHVLCRQLVQHEHAFPLSNGAFVFGEGPFSVASEMQVFEALDVRYLVLRNSGSLQGRTKVDAACALGIKVIMIEQGQSDLPDEQVAPINKVVERVIEHANY